jgi:hypothetical protein
MAFRNEITAGTTLIREAIQSQGFQTGVDGWTINSDGSAEFNNVIIRGGTVVSGLALYYNGPPAAGNLILSIAAAAGTDPFGNAYPAGLGVYGTDGDLTVDDGVLLLVGSNGSQVALSAGGVGGASVFLTPQNLGGATWLDGSIATTLGASNRPGTVVSSPSEDSNTSKSQISLFGGGPSTSDTYILFAAGRFSFNALVQIFASHEVTGSVTAGNSDHGTGSAVMAAVASVDVPVNFNKTFPATPRVTATLRGNPTLPATSSSLIIRTFNITTSGCTVRVNDVNATARTLTHAFDWHAESD